MSPNGDDLCRCCKAQWIFFELKEQLAGTSCKDVGCISDWKEDGSSAEAEVLDYWQGDNPGENQSSGSDGTVDVYNFPMSIPNSGCEGECAFAGDAGDRGLACYDDIDDIYRIVTLFREHEVCAFELAQNLPQWSDTPVEACKKKWKPDAHGGWGGYETDAGDRIKVADWRKVGYFGYAGAEGAAVIKQSDNGPIGVICDLECPPECLCGETNPYDYDKCK